MGDQAPRNIVEIAQNESAKSLLVSTLNALTAIQANLHQREKQAHDFEYTQSVEYYDFALGSIATLLEDKNLTVTPSPRIPRKDDKMQFFTGDHAGVSVQYTARSGIIARINFYGGLRNENSTDVHNADPAMRTHHTHITDNIASQPTHINIHMYELSNSEPIFDLWLINTPKQTSLSVFKFDQKRQDVSAVLPATDPRFNPTHLALRHTMKDLIKIVQNPYYIPR